MVISEQNVGGISHVDVHDLLLNGTGAKHPMGGVSVLGYANAGGGEVRGLRFERIFGDNLDAPLRVDLNLPTPVTNPLYIDHSQVIAD